MPDQTLQQEKSANVSGLPGTKVPSPLAPVTSPAASSQEKPLAPAETKLPEVQKKETPPSPAPLSSQPSEKKVSLPQSAAPGGTPVQGQVPLKSEGVTSQTPPGMKAGAVPIRTLPGQTSTGTAAGEAKPLQGALQPRSPLPLSRMPLNAAQTPISPALQTGATSFAPQRGMETLDFDDADVYTIIQTIFGNVLRVNYVVDPRIKGRVTFRAVAPVPTENVLPLMEVILRLNGVGVVEENGLYRLVPISDVSKEPSPVSYGRESDKIQVKGKALLQVVPIMFVPSSDVVKLITPFASSNAVIIDVPKGNQIIIVDTDSNVKRLLKLVEIFDNEKLKKTKPQVFVYAVQNGKAKDIAAVLQQTFLGTRPASATGAAYGATSGTQTAATTTAAGTATGYGASGYGAAGYGAAGYGQASSIMLVSDFTRFIADEVTNSIIILSTPEEYLLIKIALDKIDIIPRQVMIEGVIAEVTLTDNLSIGIASWLKGRTVGSFTTSGGIGGAAITGDLSTPAGSGLVLYGVDNIGNLQFLLTALSTDVRSKLLATPHILVSDNREAKIQVGQQVPLVTSETYGSTTVAPQRTIQYTDIGIIMKVKPRVNE
ncbi:MAG: secretin N-terminal domain-containing protein, partial [Syntrophales bacterium]|nr:secretin N-terminal domain-containing protein [Syntrophales bacterium]